MLHHSTPSTTESIRTLLLGQQWATDQQGTLLLTLPPTELPILVRTLAAQGFFPTQAWMRRLLAQGFDPRQPEQWFEARAYQVRPPTLDDLPTLLQLEVACWPEPLRATAEELQLRITRFPEGQLALVWDGALVGVVYSQRIREAAALSQHDFRSVAVLHDPHGPIAQPLAINVLPAVQQYGLGDQLLEFLLQFATLTPGISQVAAVTLCQAFAAQSLPMEQYIQLRSATGLPVDPILAFHVAHGAQIRGVVEGYRPPDTANQGKGVLVAYDLQTRLALREERTATAIAPSALPLLVAEQVRTILGAERAEQFADDRPLHDLGFSSLELHELATALRQTLGRELEASFFFRFPTVATIARALAQEVAGRTTPYGATASVVRSVEELPPVDRVIATREGIAIIGMACRFPGGATNPEAFWQLLVDGVDAIGEVPHSRWDTARLVGTQPGQMVSSAGGFLEDVDQFDAAFFRIAPVEATTMDPQQRLLLETHWEALEDAGIAPAQLAGRGAGVFVGISGDDYKLLQVKQEAPLHPYFSTGTANAIAAGRVAYVLGTHGPALAVDTACSSSLVAVHLACQSLLQGECELAMASGVNLLLSPEASITFSQTQMLAPDGRCKSFDAAANGYVRSEGCGVVVLKRVADAERDGDRILAVVRGSAINQDGASNGLTAPNGAAQEGVYRAALAAAAVRPEAVGYVEAHGTGTPLGDPIEVQGLAAVYAVGRSEGQGLVIGSVKTNIGHLEAAAGVAGLIKLVLMLQAGIIPAHLHLRERNPQLGGGRSSSRRRGWGGQPQRMGSRDAER